MKAYKNIKYKSCRIERLLQLKNTSVITFQIFSRQSWPWNHFYLIFLNILRKLVVHHKLGEIRRALITKLYSEEFCWGNAESRSETKLRRKLLCDEESRALLSSPFSFDKVLGRVRWLQKGKMGMSSTEKTSKLNIVAGFPQRQF